MKTESAVVYMICEPASHYYQVMTPIESDAALDEKRSSGTQDAIKYVRLSSLTDSTSGFPA